MASMPAGSALDRPMCSGRSSECDHASSAALGHGPGIRRRGTSALAHFLHSVFPDALAAIDHLLLLRLCFRPAVPERISGEDAAPLLSGSDPPGSGCPRKISHNGFGHRAVVFDCDGIDLFSIFLAVRQWP